MSSRRYKSLNIVSIGGGTGLSTLLSGLKKHVKPESVQAISEGSGCIESLSAIVTVTDDGGSSGRLRQEFQILPPGDIRNCMVALAEDENLMTRLFQYRFDSEGALSNHSFGNLFLTALTSVTGDFLDAIKLSSEVLAIKGRIFPSTMEDVNLLAELESGEIVEGETRITGARSRIRRLWLSREGCKPLPETLAAIENSDLITIGPGSLFTSIIPNLLVDGMAPALTGSGAHIAYICNIMTQPGETEGFSMEDHIRLLYRYAPGLRIDYIIANSMEISIESRDKYKADGASQVRFESDVKEIFLSHVLNIELEPGVSRRFHMVCGDLLDEKDVIRHNPDKLAAMVLEILLRDDRCRESRK